MKFVVGTKRQRLTGKTGPMCLACGNTRTFYVYGKDGPTLADMQSLPPGEVQVAACGKCRSRHSIVIGLID